jgi:stage II sporulation protein E
VSELKLFDGDVLLMTSDGVEDATAREILRCGGMNAQEIVTVLGAKALAQRTGGRRDDITIIAAKIFLRDENGKWM